MPWTGGGGRCWSLGIERGIRARGILPRNILSIELSVVLFCEGGKRREGVVHTLSVNQSFFSVSTSSLITDIILAYAELGANCCILTANIIVCAVKSVNILTPK